MVAFKDPSGEVVVEVNGLWDIEHGWGQEVFAPVGGFFEHDGVVYEFSANASLVGWHDWELEWDGGEVYFSDEVADESYDNVFNVPLSLIESAEVFVPPSLEAESFEAVHDDYLISMKRNNPLSRHYIPSKKKSAAETFKDGTGCISQGSFPGMTCEYCGFDPHDLVYYQCKQNDEDLTWDEWKEEVEFYFYEGSHAEQCQGLIDEMDAKEADYTIDMINSHGIKWSGEIKEKKKAENRQPPWSATNRKPQRKMECGECHAKGFIAGKECPTCDGAGYWMEPSPRCATCDSDIEWTDGAECEGCEEWVCNDCLGEDYSCPKCENTDLSFHAETFEAYNPEQPRDEGGRWISDDSPPALSPWPEAFFMTHPSSKITLRQLSEAVMETTHNHLDFDTAHELVNRMLSQHPAGDSQEARTALLLTLEETQMQLEYADEIGWDMELEIMAGLLRSHGIEPPEEYEEAVINRLTFEDEWATEETLWGERDSLICDTSNCDEILSYDESFGWRGHDYCEECYDYWLMKDRQSLLTEDTDCLECGFSIHPEDVRQSLNEDGYCEHCLKNLSDRTNAAEETVGYDKPLGESLNWTPYEYRDSKNNKPNKPTPAKDFDMADTFGRSVLLMSETFESSNYKCVSCGLSFAQEDTRDIDGEIVCDDCVYEIYSMDEFDGETFGIDKWETGDLLTLANISELIADAQHMGCLVTSYDSREVLDSSHLIDDKDWRNTIIEIYTDYRYTDASDSKFNYDHKFVYDFEWTGEVDAQLRKTGWKLVSLEQPYAVSMSYPYHIEYIVQSTDPEDAVDMAVRGEGKRSSDGDLSKYPIFSFPASVDWEPNPDDAHPLFD